MNPAPRHPMRPLPLSVSEARRLVRALSRLQAVLWDVYQDAFFELDELTEWAEAVPDRDATQLPLPLDEPDANDA